MSFTLTVLGSSSALPTATTNPTAHLLKADERFFLIDCGEGTQMQLRRNHVKIQRIHHVFISHLHGDHYFGLIGLITTMQLLGRVKTLHIYSPPGLKAIIELQRRPYNHYENGDGNEIENTSSDKTSKKEDDYFPIIFHELETRKNTVIFDDNKISVETIPLKHRIPCCGFLFREKPKLRKILPEMILKHKISIEQIQKIKLGENLQKEDGTIITNEEITLPALDSESYAFCSDTRFNESIIPIIKGVDLLYHEATFLHELEHLAKKTAHSTALQAATIAMKAEVKQLIIGHFSARYKNKDVLLNEAKTVFENTVVAEEGKTYSPTNQ